MVITGVSSAARRILPEAGPARILAAATLVDTLGRGLFLSVSVIFFTRSVGLSVTAVSLGLSIAAGAALLTSTPMGYVADRYGPREVLIGAAAIEAVATAALVLVHEFWGFVVLAVLTTVVGRAAGAARGATIAGLFPAQGRVRVQAYQRAVTNVGISTGTVFAGLALAVDTRTAYVALILGDALTYVVMAVMLLRLPHVERTPCCTCSASCTRPPGAGGWRSAWPVRGRRVSTRGRSRWASDWPTWCARCWSPRSPCSGADRGGCCWR